MFCQNCGKKISDQAAFCPECGARTNEAGPGVSAAADTSKGKKKVNNRWIGIIVVAVVILGVVMAGRSLVGGKEYRELVDRYVEAVAKEDKEAIFYMLPQSVRDAAVKQSGLQNEQQVAALMGNGNAFSAYLPKVESYDYKITDERKLGRSELQELTEDYTYGGIEEFHPSAAMEVDVDLSIVMDSGETSEKTMTISLVKIDKAWYLDMNNTKTQ